MSLPDNGKSRWPTTVLLTTVSLLLIYGCQNAQPNGSDAAPAASAEGVQVTGVVGSPSATTTIDGRSLPPRPPKFGGVERPSSRVSIGR